MKKHINNTLLNIINSAIPEDIKYQKESINCHYELQETKVGYRPISIKSINIPSFLTVTFVKAESKDNQYFYVINRTLKSYEVANEAEAKLAVLLEMRYILRNHKQEQGDNLGQDQCQ